jgi:hydrogenase maturation protease
MTLVLCFGNPLRGDDAVGWRVAEQLAAGDTWVCVVACHALVAELAAVIAAAEVIIFVNASAGARSGEVHCTRIHPVNASAATQRGDTTAGLLALAKIRYHSRPAVYLITIAAEQFEMGTPLSPAVTDAPRAVALIEAFAAQVGGSSSPRALTNAG